MSLKFILLIGVIASIEIDSNDAFRTDYTYIALTDSYYKFHGFADTWADAKAMCKAEGGLLFHPETEEELKKVLSVLGVESDIHAGISDIEKIKNYVTVDGRPISQVYKKWGRGEPDSCSEDVCRCGVLNIKTTDHVIDKHNLSLYPCKTSRAYICKHYQEVAEDQVKVLEEVTSTIAKSSDRLYLVLGRLAKVGANQTVAIDRMTSNLVAALDRMTVNQALDRQRPPEYTWHPRN